jgi:hypothetical protein
LPDIAQIIPDDFPKIVVIPPEMAKFPSKNREKFNKMQKKASAEKAVFFTKCQEKAVFGDNLYFRNDGITPSSPL